MVVLSAAVCTKSGRPLVARQFVPMSKLRVEGLLAAFPKLVESGAQHTFVETDDVRYVYQPVEQLYALVITNKASNIMEDLETLRMVVKLIPEFCQGVREENVVAHSFDLIFALDEVISMGYKESATLQQVRTFTEMDSHEEKLQKIIMESKVSDARQTARAKAEAIDKRKAEERRSNRLQGHGGGGGGGGFGGGGDGDDDDYRGGYGGRHSSSSSSSRGGGRSGGATRDSRDSEFTSATTSEVEAKRAGGGGGSSSSSSSASRVSRGKAMQLGKVKKSTDDFLAALSREEGVVPLSGAAAAAAAAAGGGGGVGDGGAASIGGMGGIVAGEANESQHVHLSVEERLSVSLERDGAVKRLEVRGEVKLTVFDPDESKVAVHTGEALAKENGFQCRLHPKIDKQAYAKEGVLRLKDPKRGFPVGSDNAPTLLKWRMASSEEDQIPFTINLWPNPENGRSVVSVEVAHVREALLFRDVYISIPCDAGGERPQVTEVSGEYNFNSKENVLTWRIGEISEDNADSTLEFSVPEVDADSFFPVNVSFTSSTTYSGLSVQKVVRVDGTAQEVPEFSESTQLVAEKFVVE